MGRFDHFQKFMSAVEQIVNETLHVAGKHRFIRFLFLPFGMIACHRLNAIYSEFKLHYRLFAP